MFYIYFALLWTPPILKIAFVENSMNNIFQFIIYLILLLALFSLLNFRLKKFAIVTLPLLTINIFEIVHFLNYREIITIGGWAAIFESNYLEAKEFVFARPSSYIVLLIHIGIFFATVLYSREFFPHSGRKIKIMAALILGIFCVEFFGFGFCRAVYPFESILALQNYFEEKKNVTRYLESKKNWSYGAKRRSNSPGSKETYIIVIGESARRSNMEIYGYKKPTNQRLRKEKLWVFKDAISPANITRESLRLILTPGTVKSKEEAFKKTSIVGLAKELGFITYWIGNQSRYGFRDSEITAIAKESHHIHFTNTYWAIPSLDSKVLPVLNKMLKEPAEKKIIFIHLLGNHIAYKKRYPPEFNSVSDLYKTGSQAEKTTSEYDISTAYLDSILAEMIYSLKGRNHISGLVYFSDHGEFLFDKGSPLFGHGFPHPYPQEYEVPFIVWTSPAYEIAHPEVIKGIQSNLNKKLQLENLFYSLAFMVNGSFPGFNSEHNFFSLDYKEPETRQVSNPAGELFIYENF